MNPLDLPQLTKHVTDFSGALSPSQVESLSTKFAEHEQATTEQVLTVFIPHRQGNELIDIGLKLFNENNIGQKDLNNGLLLIVSTEEKKLRIITGKGMEIKYSEMVCREIVENHLRPLLDEGKYEELLREWNEIINTGSDIAIDHRISNNRLHRNGDLLSFIASGTCMMSIVLYFVSQSNLGYAVISFILYAGMLFLLIGLVQINRNIIRNGFILMLIGFIVFGAAGIIAKTTSCTNNLYCTQNIFGYEYSYQTYIIENSNNGNSSSSTDWSSSDSSSSSSFDGGGGSSNGGGYGD